jgi:hypothetical protein
VTGAKPWSNTDDDDLKRMIRQGCSLKEAADILERSFDDVQQRLKVLGSRMPGATSLKGASPEN